MNTNGPRIVISAGEPSGDEHAAKLMASLRLIMPGASFSGMGGSALRGAGMNICVDSDVSGAVMGFFPVIAALGRIKNALTQMRELLRNWKPDALVLVDYPDFNLRLAKTAKQLGIPVLYFIPPKMWAWRPSRIEQFHRLIDCTALIYPFEKKFFSDHNYKNAYFVGHPFVTELAPDMPSTEQRRAFTDKLKIAANSRLVALLPGSRNSEIRRLLNPTLEALALIKDKHPNVMGVLALAPSVNESWVRENIPGDAPLVVSRGNALEVMKFAEVGLLKSGTSNLQAAFLNLPFVMYYETSALSAFIARKLVKLSEYSPVNIVRPGTIKELIQEEVCAERIFTELSNLLDSSAAQEQIRSSLNEVRLALSSYEHIPLFEGSKSAYDRTALLIERLSTGHSVDTHA